MRYTEYHAGVAVIKKNQTKGAAAKLDKIEDMDYIPQICCDEYCKYPGRSRSQAETDQICDECKLAELFDLLVDNEKKF